MAATSQLLAILRDMALGAGVSGLRIVGSIVFQGAWPIIEGALDPVLDRLKDKLGTADPLDEDHAKKAWAELRKDRALVAMFEQGLRTEIDPLRTSQTELTEGQRRLVQLVDGNTDILKVIQADLDRMRTEGVTVARPSIDAIRQAVGQEFTELMRSLELRLEHLTLERDDADAMRRDEIRKRFRDQLARTQARAVELLNADEFDRAADELRAGLSSLELLIDAAPDDLDLRVNLGYYYKTIAEVFARIDETSVPGSVDRDKVADEFRERALSIFYFVARGVPLDRKSAADHAHALNGVGNIYYARKDYDLALDNYDRATRVDPYYCYAWHDMFAAYYALAGLGRVDFPAMRHALDKTWETGQGQPGLGRKRLEQLEGMIATYDPTVIIDRLIEEGVRQFPDLAPAVRSAKVRPDRAPVADESLNVAVRAAKRGASEVARPVLEQIIREHDEGVACDPRRAAIAKRHLAAIVARSDMATAHAMYTDAVALDPDDADAWHDLGSIDRHLGRTGDAARYVMRAAVEARKDGNLDLAGEALEHAADALLATPDGVAHGVNLARGLLYLFAARKDDDGLLRTYQKLVRVSIEYRDIPTAENFIHYGLDLARTKGFRLDEANLLLSAATVCIHRKDNIAAIERLQDARCILEETGPDTLLEQIDQDLETLRHRSERVSAPART